MISSYSSRLVLTLLIVVRLEKDIKFFLSLLEIPSQNCTNGLKRFLEKKTRCLGILIKRNNYSFPANFYNPMIIVDDKVDDAGLFCQRAAFP